MATGYRKSEERNEKEWNVRPGSHTRYKFRGKEIDPRLWSLIDTYSKARVKMGENGSKLAKALPHPGALTKENDWYYTQKKPKGKPSAKQIPLGKKKSGGKGTV